MAKNTVRMSVPVLNLVLVYAAGGMRVLAQHASYLYAVLEYGVLVPRTAVYSAVIYLK